MRKLIAVVAILALAGSVVLGFAMYAARDDGTVEDRTFGQEFLLQLADNLYGAIATGLFVAGGAAIAVWEVQRRADSRRAARELEHEYVGRASKIAGSLYFETQLYWRQKREPSVYGNPDPGKLTASYGEFATKAEIFEQELASRYSWDSAPRVAWHQIRDLLTVRYFALIDRASDRLLMLNSKGYDEDKHKRLTLQEFLNQERDPAVTPSTKHSGLTVDELRNQEKLLTTYRKTFTQFHQDLSQ